VSFSYTERAFVTLAILRAMRMLHIFICDLPRFATFFHIIEQTARFSKKKVTEHKMCVLVFSTAFV
jgi:hypothetical protein